MNEVLGCDIRQKTRAAGWLTFRRQNNTSGRTRWSFTTAEIELPPLSESTPARGAPIRETAPGVLCCMVRDMINNHINNMQKCLTFVGRSSGLWPFVVRPPGLSQSFVPAASSFWFVHKTKRNVSVDCWSLLWSLAVCSSASKLVVFVYSRGVLCLFVSIGRKEITYTQMCVSVLRLVPRVP